MLSGFVPFGGPTDVVVFEGGGGGGAMRGGLRGGGGRRTEGGIYLAQKGGKHTVGARLVLNST